MTKIRADIVWQHFDANNVVTREVVEHNRLIYVLKNGTMSGFKKAMRMK